MSELLLRRPVEEIDIHVPDTPTVQNEVRQTVDAERAREQSLETLKILLAVSFGSIAAIRELLPPESLVQETFEFSQNQTLRYKEFTDLPTQRGGGRRGTVIHRIQRGFSPEADKLLDALELGVFEALSREYLQALQLNVFLDAKHPDELIESYVFAIRYDQYGAHLTIPGMKPDTPPSDEPIKELSQLMKGLFVGVETLTPLPQTKNFTIRLFYTRNAPYGYTPDYFDHVSKPKPNIFVTPNDAQFLTTKMGKSKLGPHTLAIDVSAVKFVRNGVVYKRRRPRPRIYQSIDFLQPDVSTPKIDQQQPSDQEILYSQPAFSQVLDFSQRKVPDTYEEETVEASRIDSFDERIQMGLKGRWEDDPFDTRTETQQSAVPIKHGLENKVQPMAYEDLRDTATPEAPEAILQSQASLQVINEAAQQQTQVPSTTDGEDENVSCECGDNKDDRGSYFQCNTCREWKHSFCYGYTDVKDIPDIVRCFSCSPKAKNVTALQDFKVSAITRRIIEYMTLQTEEWTASGLFKDIVTSGFTNHRVRDVVSTMSKKGFIQPLDKAQIKTKNKSGVRFAPLEKDAKVFKVTDEFPFFKPQKVTTTT